MNRQIIRKLRSVVVGFGVAGASVFTAAPMEGCDQDALKRLLEMVPATPQIPLPPPTDSDDDPDVLATLISIL